MKRYYLGMQGLPSWCSRQQEVGWGYHVKPFCCHGFDLKPSLVQLKEVWDIVTKSVEWNACSTCCAGADLAVRRSRTAVALLRMMNFYWYDVSLLFFHLLPFTWSLWKFESLLKLWCTHFDEATIMMWRFWRHFWLQSITVIFKSELGIYFNNMTEVAV